MPVIMCKFLNLLFSIHLAISLQLEGRQNLGYPRPGLQITSRLIYDGTVAQPNITNSIVLTQDGALRGFTMKTVSSRAIAAYQGIPFAQPPIGKLRFRDPVRNERWSGVRDAIAHSPQCIQTDIMRQNEIHGQEDCLYLNVYTPQQALDLRRKLPVIVFIHGGAFFFGAGSIYGPEYLLDQDVVLVTFNYRLGPFGFLSTGDEASSGNQGMKDQVMVLRWVQANIKVFGGDPNSVTIFGESVGACAVQHHFVSPMSRGLFHRGISASGSAFCFWSIAEQSPGIAARLGEHFKCGGSTQEMVECFRTIEASQLAFAQLTFPERKFGYPVLFYGPVVEKNHSSAFLIETPEESYKHNRAAKVPWITGYIKNEWSWVISALFLNSTIVTGLNNEWDSVIPILLGIHNRTGNDAEIARRIRDFYFEGKNVTFETRLNLVDLFGDRLFVECGSEAMRYHSRFTGQPVYAYQFSFQGKYSVVQNYGQNPKDWGVAHLDELIYLFNNTDYYSTLLQKDVEELAMSQIITGIWSNFATYGRPYVNRGNKLVDLWQPIPRSTSVYSPLTFLDLNLDPKMIKDPYVDRYNFWKSLRLED